MGTTPVVSGLRHAADQRGDRADHSVQSLHSAGRAASHRHGSGAVLPGRTSSSWPRRTSTIWVDQRAARVVSAPRVETLSGSSSHQQRPQVVQRQRCLRHTNLVGHPNTGKSTNSTSRIQSGQSLTPDHVHVGQPDQQRAHSRSIGFQAGVPCNSTTSTSLRLAEPLWHAWGSTPNHHPTITQPSDAENRLLPISMRRRTSGGPGLLRSNARSSAAMGLDRILRDVHGLSDLPDRQFLVVVEHETGTLAFRNETQRVEDGTPDRAAALRCRSDIRPRRFNNRLSDRFRKACHVASTCTRPERLGKAFRHH